MNLGAASKHFFSFFPESWLEDSQFDEHIGQMVWNHQLD